MQHQKWKYLHQLWLGAYPEECIEYVVVHELTHLLERGHNARFYGLLDQHYPDWKVCRERLKQDP
ncbi:M48 family peptidase [Clostridiaceae bacterium AF42-6]|nr:M48 family peptidase [Clostridiaceae bacterium AF42-6]